MLALPLGVVPLCKFPHKILVNVPKALLCKFTMDQIIQVQERLRSHGITIKKNSSPSGELFFFALPDHLNDKVSMHTPFEYR